MQPWRRTDGILPDRTARAWRLEHNQYHSRQVNAACAWHIAQFPRELVAIESDIAAFSLRPLGGRSRPPEQCQ